MFCKRPPRMARHAAVVAAIIMAMLPSQALVCRHCLLHNIVELANEHTSDEHPHVHDSLNAECTDCCGKSHSGEDEGSHRDCPNCVGSIDDGILLSSNVPQLVQSTIAYLLPVPAQPLQPQVRHIDHLNLRSKLASSSLPIVLRI